MPHNKKPHQNLFIVIYLNEIIPLSAGLKSFLATHIKSTVFAKGDLICKKGQVCTNLHVIKKGVVRGFFMADETEVTTWISSDNDIFTSITGYFRNEVAMENIQALEETHCVYLSYEDMHFCLKNFPEMRDLNRILMEDYYLHAENRAYLARIPSALGRWHHYRATSKSEIIDRIPKKYLASFLNMRPETLSRLLKNGL
ncbi:Crp/Fnr family transcriptional regulator [Arenibacter sp. GZD96]|uniref:Crp/Fnr family transcriptional regulator n=1 Tax=Aurantibrevibacter litoralis TaxID=3106030 RepID=UPI002AFF2E9B|nr:Crp/Fnr family transcriptional regulator [Arenibacter sp. GZD-96]MEA1786172.1 Crp/Fnr family transcriptional regulator [Arenibacter sp. GZD-96]